MMQHREEKSPVYKSEEKYETRTQYNDQKDQGYYGGYTASSSQSNYPPSPKPAIPLPRGYSNPYNNSYSENNTLYDNASTSPTYEKQSVQENKIEEEYPIGYGVSENDVEDLFSYCRHGRIVEIERHLDKGIPIDVRDTYGNTLLIIACQNGNKRVAKLLLRRGANINGRNHKGNTPLHYCYTFGYGDTLGSYLMTKGADSSIRNNQGKLSWDGI